MRLACGCWRGVRVADTGDVHQDGDEVCPTLNAEPEKFDLVMMDVMMKVSPPPCCSSATELRS